ARVRQVREVWPRNPMVVKQLADLVELSGQRDAALALREEALRLDGADLTLRRAVERARTGRELLSDQAVSGKDAIAAYEAQRGPEDAAFAFVLDSAAVR